MLSREPGERSSVESWQRLGKKLRNMMSCNNKTNEIPCRTFDRVKRLELPHRCSQRRLFLFL